MQDSFDITTIIFLALAVFVIWRLRSVLGQKTGAEQPPFDPAARREPPVSRTNSVRTAEDNVVRLPGAPDRGQAAVALAPDRWKGVAEAGSPVARGLDAIAQVEPAFDAKSFLDGAKAAYEMIVTAFAQGDRQTLRNLLSREVFEGFEGAIADRERRGEKVETTFVSIDKAELAGVEVRPSAGASTAQVTVRFLSKLITVTRDPQGRVVDGSPDTVVDVPDIWTFARPLGSRDPNWQLVATESGQ